jgi:arylsulfatase A-like enzyme
MTDKVNVLLIVVDTLRADHLGCYGHRHGTSPNIDALATGGVLAERMFCEAIPTQPSFTTLYTGLHPIVHGIIAHNDNAVLTRKTPVLPELFLEAGYATCAVDNLGRARPWFQRGYEFIIDPSLRHILPLGVTCEELNARAIPWLRAFAGDPFFMMVHYWDPHYPLVPPGRFRGLFYEGSNPTDPANRSLATWWEHPLGMMARDTWLRTADGLITDADYLVALYDQEIRYLDEGVGSLLQTLEDLGLAENTLVLLMADHGESLTEHGIYFEHHGLYDCTTRIPLIMRWPGRLPAVTRLPQLLHTSDIAPTLLEAAGLPTPGTVTGRSFWKLAAGQAQSDGHQRVICAESTVQAKWSLRTDRHKLILAREPDFYDNPPRELYDLVADPGETHNLAQEQPELAASLEAELEGWIADQLRQQGKTTDPVGEQGISFRANWRRLQA